MGMDGVGNNIAHSALITLCFLSDIAVFKSEVLFLLSFPLLFDEVKVRLYQRTFDALVGVINFVKK